MCDPTTNIYGEPSLHAIAPLSSSARESTHARTSHGRYYIRGTSSSSNATIRYTSETHTRVSIRHRFGQTMLLATLSTNSATPTDGIDAE